ncbi:hypothetical protein ABW20_dc0106853 [Dactylellina cionopaga]|nr:hypothetical protein ABW20_dc0106853 [Dactylellina cionopaga]
MDPRLAQILQTLNETTSSAPPNLNFLQQLQAQQAPPPAQSQLPYQQPKQNYDPRQIYQPDRPQPAPVAAIPPAPARSSFSEPIDPRTITQWPAALKYITTFITTNAVAMDRLKKMKLHQRDHETQWWQSRDAIVKRHSNSSSNRMAMDSVMKSFGIASVSADLTPEEKLQELKTYDEKVYRASEQMYKSMAEDLKKLGIPFFVLSEEEFTGDKATFKEARRKVVELLDDLS